MKFEIQILTLGSRIKKIESLHKIKIAENSISEII